MKSSKGIALVVSLLVMAVIMALGIGGLGLATMNSRIAENVRAATLAKADADGDVNAALVMLEWTYANNGRKFPASVNGKFPSSVSIPRVNNTPAFAAADYTYVTTADQREFTLTVRGRTVSGGLHRSEVLVSSNGGVPKLRGLISEGDVR